MKENFTQFPLQVQVSDASGLPSRGWLQLFASAGKILAGLWATFSDADSASSATPYAVQWVGDLEAGAQTVTLPAPCKGLAFISASGTVTTANVDGQTVALTLAVASRVMISGVRS